MLTCFFFVFYITTYPLPPFFNWQNDIRGNSWKRQKKASASFYETDWQKRSRIRFTNYDKYDRREALETFLDASYLRRVLEKEEEMQKLEN